MPVINRRDDAVRVGGPDKGWVLRVCGCPCRFMVDRDLERNAPRLHAAPVSEAKKVSTAFAQRQEVGAK